MEDVSVLRQKLREAEENFRTIVENVSGVVYLVSMEDDPVGGTVRLVGGQVEEIVGYEPADFLRDPGLWFRLLHPDDVPELMNVTQTMLVRKEPVTRRYRIRHKKSGKYRWVEDRVVPKMDPQGNVTSTLGIARDITDRKLTGEDVAQQTHLWSLVSDLSLADEQERRRILGELGDRIMRNLNASKTCLDVLRGGVATDELRRSVERLSETVEQTFGTVTSLLQELSPPVLYDIGFASAIRLLAAQFQKKWGIPFEVHDDEESKPLDAEDRTFLFQATRELLLNVVKHSKATQVEISLRREESKIFISVEDNGIGFSPFEIHPNWDGRLGLYNIQGKLSFIGGTLEISSAPGKGACVTLEAPLKQ